MMGGCGLCVFLGLLLFLQSTRGEWRVSVEFVNYTAPAVGPHSHGCDHPGNSHAECDPLFHICQGNGHSLTCSDSVAYNDTHSIVFGQDGSALVPPHVFATMPTNYIVDVKVLDKDAGNHTQASIHFTRHSFPKNSMKPGAVIPVALRRNGYRLVFNLVVQCNPPNVGPNCDCLPHGNVLCNATTGHHYCAPGFSGRTCKHANTSCLAHTCQGAGRCEDTPHGFLCHCDPGFSGKHCEINVNECAHVTCQNGGTCSDDVNGYLCECALGFFGRHCETAVNDTKEVVCQNGGSRVAANNTCHCPHGYTGQECQIKLAGCLINPCKNGGYCGYHIASADGSFSCQCSFGYSGALCEVDETDPCSIHRCRHGGTCHSILSMAYCHCNAGYKGEYCEVVADECSSSPCLHGSTCHDGVNFFTCYCPSGYVGDRCQYEIGHAPIVG